MDGEFIGNKSWTKDYPKILCIYNCGANIECTNYFGISFQLEIILIRVTQNRTTFEFPFFLMTTNLWVARDLWYLFLIFGWVLGVYSGFKLGEVREFETLSADPKDATIIKEIIKDYQENKRESREY